MDIATSSTPTADSGSSSSSQSSSTPSSSGSSTSSSGSEPKGTEASKGQETQAQGESQAKPTPGKYKLKRFGAEVEATPEDLVSWASDDYEHEIEISGQKRKAKYADLVRGYQKAEGSFERLREAAEQRKQLEEMLEFAKQKPEWILENKLGIKDHRLWAQQVIQRQIEEETQLERLAQTNPSEYHREMERRAAARIEARNAYEADKQKRQQDYETAQKANQERRSKGEAALKGVGLPVNAITLQLLGQAYTKYKQVGEEPDLASLAHEVREDFTKEVFGFLDSHEGEGLLKLLGDDRRKKLRDLELQALKGKQPEPKKDDEDAPRRRAAPVAEISEAAFKRKLMGA